MSSAVATRFLVNKQQFAKTQWVEEKRPTKEQLAEGQLLLSVDCFAFTANNITYAAMGNALRYWEFFPAEEGQGVIPVWGFADVIESRCGDIAVGERLYGYYPMATHLIVEPGHITSASFIDVSTHRQPLSVIYNQYLRTAVDPLYNADSEAMQMLLRPLFTTSFLLDDLFDDTDFYGAETLVLTSASSKTALGLAYLLQQHRNQRQHHYEIVGLTSSRNLKFVEGLGCYDRVLNYEQVSELDASKAAATIDFAGMGELLVALHQHYADQLKYSCLVGASHWDARGGLPKELPGAVPTMFFAPSQAEKRLKEWGGAEFQKRLASAWYRFNRFVADWMVVNQESGKEAVERIYQQTLAGNIDPKMGYILSLHDQ